MPIMKKSRLRADVLGQAKRGGRLWTLQFMHDEALPAEDRAGGDEENLETSKSKLSGCQRRFFR